MNIPAIFNIFVDDSGNSHSEESVVPAAHEHDRDREADSKHGQRPEGKSNLNLKNQNWGKVSLRFIG